MSTSSQQATAGGDAGTLNDDDDTAVASSRLRLRWGLTPVCLSALVLLLSCATVRAPQSDVERDLRAQLKAVDAELKELTKKSGLT